jgi:hypothetical protein
VRDAHKLRLAAEAFRERPLQRRKKVRRHSALIGRFDQPFPGLFGLLSKLKVSHMLPAVPMITSRCALIRFCSGQPKNATGSD